MDPRPHDTGHLDILLESAGAAGRKLLASVLAGVEFKRSGVDEDELLAALRLIGELAGTGRRWLPGFAPSAFIDQQWRAHVVDVARGRLDRCAYELCARLRLRGALRARRVGVPGSRRHADPASLLLPDELCQEARTEFVQAVDRPVAAERLRAARPPICSATRAARGWPSSSCRPTSARRCRRCCASWPARSCG